MDSENRRPITTRSARWAQSLARYLAGVGFTPNLVSVLGLAIAGGGACFFLAAATSFGVLRAALLFGAAACIQLRLLCNMLDGLIAVENNLKSKLGDLFNEVPDRIEDVVLLIAAGYAAATYWGEGLGWVAALLAVGTAYVRLLGGSLGCKQDFCGPCAKPQRMFVLTLASVGGAGEAVWADGTWSLTVGLGVIVAGTLGTLARRLLRLARTLQAR